MVDLLSYLPPAWANSPEFCKIQEALGKVADDLWAARTDYLLQLSPMTATWGLDSWEQALGITPKAGSTTDARRAAIGAKMQAADTTTAASIKAVAELYFGGYVLVTEDSGSYKVTIRSAETKGEPADYALLKQTLKEIMPAHLSWELVLKYTTWDEVEPYTWDQISKYTWDSIRVADL